MACQTSLPPTYLYSRLSTTGLVVSAGFSPLGLAPGVSWPSVLRVFTRQGAPSLSKSGFPAPMITSSTPPWSIWRAMSW